MNKNKKRNITTMKSVYEKCNHNKYSKLTNINDTSEVKSTYKNFVINYQIQILLTILVAFLLLIYTFKTNFVVILYCFLLLLGLFLLSIFNSTYKIKLDKNTLNVQINLQETQIPAKDLVNIYLSKDIVRFFGFPINNYMLNIIYMQNENAMLITLPTVMVNRKQLIKLFSNLEIKKIKDEEKETKQKNRNKRKTIMTISIVVFIILLIVSIVCGLQVQNGG